MPSITAEDTSASLYDKLAVDIPAMLFTIRQLLTGTAKPEKQDDESATYAKKLSKEEVVLIGSRTLTLLNGASGLLIPGL